MLSSVPPNCTFEIDDAEKEWTWTKPFDYIFIRLMVGSIADWDKLIRQCYEYTVPQTPNSRLLTNTVQELGTRRLG